MALSFSPETLLQDWSDEKYSPLHNGKTFAQCIRDAFDIPNSDTYVYRAQAETTLDIAQRAIAGKRAHGLHGWYHDEEGKPVRTTSITPIQALCSTKKYITQITHTYRSRRNTQHLRKSPPTPASSAHHSTSPKPSTASKPMQKPTRCAPR